MHLAALTRAGHARSLLAAFVHFDVSFMIWTLLGALGTYVAADLGLTPAQKGLMVAVPPLGGAACRLIVGALADTAGIKKVGLASLGVGAIPLLWGAAAARSFGEVLAIGMLLGVAGASFAVALPLASRWYPPEHQGLVLGIAGAGNSGTIVAALAAPRIAEHTGWHGVFAVALVPLALAWLTFAMLAKEPPSPRDNGAGSRPARCGPLALLAEPDARWLCGFYMVTFGGFVGLSGYLPIFFVDRFGISKVAAGTFAAVCAASGSLLRPLGGALADRAGGTRVLGAVLAAVALLGATLASGPRLAATVGLLFAMLGSFGIGNGAVFQLVPQRFGAAIGSMTGLVGAAGGVGGFLLPFGLGSLAHITGSFAAGFVAVAAAAIAAAAAAWTRHRVWRAWTVEVAA